jgi:hypothetical protein
MIGRAGEIFDTVHTVGQLLTRARSFGMVPRAGPRGKDSGGLSNFSMGIAASGPSFVPWQRVSLSYGNLAAVHELTYSCVQTREENDGFEQRRTG